MKKKLLLVLGAFFFLQASDALAADCFSCHQKNSFAGAVRHEPFAKGSCEACHAVHASSHAGLLLKKESDLCASCHPQTADYTTAKGNHGPLRQGKCTPCHNPHASDQKKLLKAPLAKTCGLCHPAEATASIRHQPYANGQCQSCHLPHLSSNAHLLAKTGDELCFGCHRQNEMASRHPGFPRPAANCLSCHDPHGSSQKGMLRNILHPPFAQGCASCHKGNAIPATDVCLSCHEDKVEAGRSLHSHILPITAGNSCTSCHSPHAGSAKGLLKQEEKSLCLGCHEETARRFDEHVSIHPGKVSCTTCHLAHGGDRPAMLKADGNGICSQCHESQGKFSHPVGDKIIDPRNRQPMTCLTCHDSKSSDYKNTLFLDGERDLCVQCHRY